MLFVQNNFTKNSFQCRVAESGEIASNADEVKLNFQDGSLICSKQQLTNVTALKILLNPKLGISDGKEINLPNCNSDIFKTVSLLVIEKKHLFEALPEEKIGPFVYEELCDDIELFHPSGKDVCYDISQQLESLTYEEANKIVKEYNEAKQANSPKVTEKIPEAVIQAKKVMRAAIFFANKNEASIHFEKIRNLELERFLCKQARDDLRMGENPALDGLVQNQRMIFLRDIAHCDQQINNLRSIADPNNLKMMDRQNVLARAEDDSNEIREMLNTYKEELETYKKKVAQCLQRNGAADRPDLMEYLVGPKAYLFDYYGLQPDQSHNLRFPFKHKNVFGASFGYRLENPGPKDLENEIRTDLQKYLSSLPDPIVKERVISKPVSSEVQKLRDLVLPLLKKWKECTDEEKSQVKQTLISYNGWEKFGIQPQDLGIRIDGDVTESTDIEAALQYNGHTIKLTFNPVDFHLLHITNGAPVPEKSLTTQMLEEYRYYYSNGVGLAVVLE